MVGDGSIVVAKERLDSINAKYACIQNLYIPSTLHRRQHYGANIICLISN